MSVKKLPPTVAQKLACDLRDNLAQICERWAELLLAFQPRFGTDRSNQELRRSLESCLLVTAQCLETGSLSPLEQSFARCAYVDIGSGVDIRDIIERMFLQKRAIWEITLGCSARCKTAEGLALDDHFINAVGLASKHYSEVVSARIAEKNQRLAVSEERQRLARELHDSVTQALYAVTLYADAARRSLESKKYDTTALHLKEVTVMAREAMGDMRSLIFELHPPKLEKAGLVAALEARIDAVEMRAGLKPQVLVKGKEQRFSPMVEEELFRIVLEALNNVIKHARAQSVQVTLEYGDELVLFIQDDGKGFESALTTGGVGLRSMRERAKKVGAMLSITSEINKGTTVTVSLPALSRSEEVQGG